MYTTYLVFRVFCGQIEIVQVRHAFIVGVRVLARREVSATDRHPSDVVLNAVVGEIRPVQGTFY